MATRRTSTNDDPARDDRAMTDRPATEVREYTDDERLAMRRSGFHQAVLPNLPKVDGWHLVWLSTDSKSAPIHKRINEGYVLVVPADLPGWELGDSFVGKWQGKDAIVWNEMVAFKIPMRLHVMFMREDHEKRPDDMETGIMGQIAEMQASSEHGETSVKTEGDGFKQLGKRRRRGDFERRELEPGFQIRNR